MKAVDTGNLAAAQTASTRLDADLWHLSQEIKDAPRPPKKDEAKAHVAVAVMPDALPAPLLSSLSIMSLKLRASILAAENAS